MVPMLYNWRVIWSAAALLATGSVIVPYPLSKPTSRHQYVTGYSLGLRRSSRITTIIPPMINSSLLLGRHPHPSLDKKTTREIISPQFPSSSSSFPRVKKRGFSRRTNDELNQPLASSRIKKRSKTILHRIYITTKCLIGLSLLTQPPLCAMAAVSSSSSSSPTTAATIATTRRLFPWPQRRQRNLLLIALSAILLLRATLSLLATRRRQSIDPTSEWTRYAQNPTARFLSLLFLFCRLLPSFLQSRFHSFLSQPLSASRALERGGDVLSEGLLRLGPLYVKIGQIVSCNNKNNAAFLPAEYLAALERLQDRVPAKSGDEARRLARESFGSEERMSEVLAEFDDVPIAAASLGQVHKGRLRSDGTVVAVKVQRENLRAIYDEDLVLLKKMARVLDRWGGGGGVTVGGAKQNWVSIFEDAEVILYREIDYRDEAANAVRFNRDFGLGVGGNPAAAAVSSQDAADDRLPSASSWLRSPYVYEHLSSEKILVMEYVPSIKINDEEKLAKANVTQQQKSHLANSLARAYLRQFTKHGFFSTDPHPGNLGVDISSIGSPSSSSSSEQMMPRLVFYDFGQACELSTDQSAGILEVIEGIIDSNVEGCVSAFQRMGVLVEDADIDKVKAKVRDNFETGKIKVKNRGKLKTIKQQNNQTAIINDETHVSSANNTNYTSSLSTTTTTNTTTTTTTVEDKDIMKYFVLPAEYAFVARALTQMDGVGKGLDPDFDFISAAAPYLVEVKGTMNYLTDELKKYVYGDILGAQNKLFRKLGFYRE